MKVAIVHDFLTKIGGAERVLFDIHQLFPDAPIYCLMYDKAGTRGMFADCEIKTSYLQKYPSFIRQRSKFLLSHFPKAIESFDLSAYDVVISSSNSFSHGVITRPQTLHITYCYSPMRYAWDWTHKYLAENNVSNGIVGLYLKNLLSKLRIWDYYASKRTDLWVAISNTVADRISKYYRQKSTVIYPPAQINELLKNTDQPGDYYLIVSRLSKYKNIDLAIKAFNKLKLPLVIIGEGSDKPRLQAISASNIKFIGWASDKKRNNYLSGCKALIFPGEDDFGLTPIEAMAAGRPVIALKAGGATETVIHNETGLFFTQTDSPEELIEKIEDFEKRAEKFDQNTIKKQAEKFSAEIFNKKFLQFVTDNYKKFTDENNS